MKKVIYCTILAMSLTLVFSQGKPCCKKKAGKGKVACKFNQANIDANKVDNIVVDGTQTIAAGIQCQLSTQTNAIDNKNCANCTKAPWWKLWGKKKGCCNTNS